MGIKNNKCLIYLKSNISFVFYTVVYRLGKDFQ